MLAQVTKGMNRINPRAIYFTALTVQVEMLYACGYNDPKAEEKYNQAFREMKEKLIAQKKMDAFLASLPDGCVSEPLPISEN